MDMTQLDGATIRFLDETWIQAKRAGQQVLADACFVIAAAYLRGNKKQDLRHGFIFGSQGQFPAVMDTSGIGLVAAIEASKLPDSVVDAFARQASLSYVCIPTTGTKVVDTGNGRREHIPIAASPITLMPALCPMTAEDIGWHACGGQEVDVKTFLDRWPVETILHAGGILRPEYLSEFEEAIRQW
jgi:hypothetical protein